MIEQNSSPGSLTLEPRLQLPHHIVYSMRDNTNECDLSGAGEAYGGEFTLGLRRSCEGPTVRCPEISWYGSNFSPDYFEFNLKNKS